MAAPQKGRPPTRTVLPVVRSNGHEDTATCASDEQKNRTSARANGSAQILDRVDGLAIHFLNHVAFLQARIGGAAVRVDVGDDEALAALFDADAERRVVAALRTAIAAR